MTYDCMTPDELTLWQKREWGGPVAKIPCRDCPLWFHEQERAAGRCCRRPSSRHVGDRGPMVRYATDEERVAARRRSWRESKKRAAARAKGVQ